MALDEAIGARIAQERIQLRPEHITAREPELQEQVCRECGSPLRQDYRFCPTAAPGASFAGGGTVVIREVAVQVGGEVLLGRAWIPIDEVSGILCLILD